MLFLEQQLDFLHFIEEKGYQRVEDKETLF